MNVMSVGHEIRTAVDGAWQKAYIVSNNGNSYNVRTEDGTEWGPLSDAQIRVRDEAGGRTRGWSGGAAVIVCDAIYGKLPVVGLAHRCDVVAAGVSLRLFLAVAGR